MYVHSIAATLHELHTLLKPVAGTAALYEAEVIMEQVLEKKRSDLYIKKNLSVTLDQYESIKTIARNRRKGIPLPYLLGSHYFFLKSFSVSPDVLIPRPETEALVEFIVDREKAKNRSFIDFGTGSGIIAETLVTLNPTWRGIALDISEKALLVAKKNCNTSISLICGDKFLALKKNKAFDFIVSNPPYISETEWSLLDESVRNHEPSTALNGGWDGMNFYRFLAHEGRDMLKHGGTIFCEFGQNQGAMITQLFAESGWNSIEIGVDLTRRPRILHACTP